MSQPFYPWTAALLPGSGEGPRALFLDPDGSVVPDTMICSGRLAAELNGQACPWSDAGRMPLPRPLDAADPTYTRDKGEPGDLCPPCAKQQLAHVGHWQGYCGQDFPAELHKLRLFKCRMWLWLVVPGLTHTMPTVIQDGVHAPSHCPDAGTVQLPAIAERSDTAAEVPPGAPGELGAAGERSPELSEPQDTEHR